MLKDLRFAFRMLGQKPGFTLVAVLALALGIGANTAIFSVVDAVLLRPLPYRQPERLVLLWERSPQLDLMSVAWPNFVDWKAQSPAFELMAARQGATFSLTGVEEPESLQGSNVSADLFPLLGVKPALGRAFTPDEDKPWARRTVVLSYGLWERRFHSDPAVIGRGIALNGNIHSVVGVMPPGFRYPATAIRADVYVPIGLNADRMQERGNHPGIYVLARLKQGVSLDRARAEMDTVARRLERQYPATNKDNRVGMDLYHAFAVRSLRPALLVLLAAVGFVLLIACANVANLLLARAVERQAEIAVRAALGAGRGQIARQVLTESLILALAGGAVGLLLGYWAMEGLVALAPEGAARISEVSMNLRVLGFALALAVATGLLFGSIPAWQISRANLADTLKDGMRRATGGAGRHRMRDALVVAEVALSLVLLIGAGLMLRSFRTLISTSPGFQPDHVLAVQVALPTTKYEKPAQWAAFHQRLLERARSLPGVTGAGLIHPVPVSGDGWQTGARIVGRQYARPQDGHLTDYARVSADYFRTMGVPLLKGRYFTEQDQESAPPVCIIDDKFARTLFANENPLGQRLQVQNKVREIVGVVGHVKNYGVDDESRIETYMPFQQAPLPVMSLMLKTAMAPAQVAVAVRQEVRGIDPHQPISQMRPMQELMDASTAPKRIAAVLLGLFAALAVVLAAVGIYGVISYSVTQRTHEIGIRMALGAARHDVLRMVVRQAVPLAALGLVIGLAGAAWLTRAMSSLLFGVGARDPLTFVAVAALIAAIALAASYIPARRATRVDPMVALRYE